MADKPRNNDNKIERIDIHENARRHIDFLRKSHALRASSMVRPVDSFPVVRDSDDARTKREVARLWNSFVTAGATTFGAMTMAVSGYDIGTKSYDIITKSNLDTVMTSQNVFNDVSIWTAGAVALSYGIYRMIRKEKAE